MATKEQAEAFQRRHAGIVQGTEANTDATETGFHFVSRCYNKKNALTLVGRLVGKGGDAVPFWIRCVTVERIGDPGFKVRKWLVWHN